MVCHLTNLALRVNLERLALVAADEQRSGMVEIQEEVEALELASEGLET